VSLAITDGNDGNSNGLCGLAAQEAVTLLRRNEVSPRELVECALQRIANVEPVVNALTTVCAGRAMRRAQAIERAAVRRVRPDAFGRGWLYGLPIVVKDVIDVAGVRCTLGSTLFAARIPVRSDIVVRTLARNGAIIIAKSNTPAFASSGGLGTCNDLFGVTRNPWNPRFTCGGSSGGSAAALASGEAWLAIGTDLGGSLRQPAAFCAVVGLRPTPGTVARTAVDPYDTLCVVGPMARNVRDVALMLDAMSGTDAADPISCEAPALSFERGAIEALPPARVAFSPSLDLVEVDPEIAALCRRAIGLFAPPATELVDSGIDFSGARDALEVLRPHWLARHWGSVADRYPGRLDSGFAERIARGRRVTISMLDAANGLRRRISARANAFFGSCDILACPTAPIAPFAIDGPAPFAATEYAKEIDWTLLTYAISLTGCPAISIPCGFTAAGLPVGLQLVAKPGADRQLISAAAFLESRLKEVARSREPNVD